MNGSAELPRDRRFRPLPAEPTPPQAARRRPRSAQGSLPNPRLTDEAPRGRSRSRDHPGAPAVALRRAPPVGPRRDGECPDPRTVCFVAGDKARNPGICRRSSGRAIQRAEFFPSAVMSATRHSIRSPVSCAPVIRASSTRHIARHRPFKTADASHEAPGRSASRRATQGSMSLSSEMRSRRPICLS
jgi:hypothetical protein